MADVRIVVLGVLVALLPTPFAAAARADSPAATKRVVRSWSARLNTYDNVARRGCSHERPAVFEQAGRRSGSATTSTSSSGTASYRARGGSCRSR